MPQSKRRRRSMIQHYCQTLPLLLLYLSITKAAIPDSQQNIRSSNRNLQSKKGTTSLKEGQNVFTKGLRPLSLPIAKSSPLPDSAADSSYYTTFVLGPRVSKSKTVSKGINGAKYAKSIAPSTSLTRNSTQGPSKGNYLFKSKLPSKTSKSEGVGGSKSKVSVDYLAKPFASPATFLNNVRPEAPVITTSPTTATRLSPTIYPSLFFQSEDSSQIQQYLPSKTSQNVSDDTTFTAQGDEISVNSSETPAQIGSSCQLNDNGFYGQARGQVYEIFYSYQAILTPQTTVLELQTDVSPLLDFQIANELLPSFFDCSAVSQRRLQNESSIGGEPSINGLSRLQTDIAITQGLSCVGKAALLNCYVFAGSVTVFGENYYLQAEVDAVVKPAIQLLMQGNLLNGVSPLVLDVQYLADGLKTVAPLPTQPPTQGSPFTPSTTPPLTPSSGPPSIFGPSAPFTSTQKPSAGVPTLSPLSSNRPVSSSTSPQQPTVSQVPTAQQPQVPRQPAFVPTVTLFPSMFQPALPATFSPAIENPSASLPSIFQPTVLPPSLLPPFLFSPSTLTPSLLTPSVSAPSLLPPYLLPSSSMTALPTKTFSPSLVSQPIFTTAPQTSRTVSPFLLPPAIKAPSSKPVAATPQSGSQNNFPLWAIILIVLAVIVLLVVICYCLQKARGQDGGGGGQKMQASSPTRDDDPYVPPSGAVDSYEPPGASATPTYVPTSTNISTSEELYGPPANLDNNFAVPAPNQNLDTVGEDEEYDDGEEEDEEGEEDEEDEEGDEEGGENDEGEDYDEGEEGEEGDEEGDYDDGDYEDGEDFEEGDDYEEGEEGEEGSYAEESYYEEETVEVDGQYDQAGNWANQYRAAKY